MSEHCVECRDPIGIYDLFFYRFKVVMTGLSSCNVVRSKACIKCGGTPFKSYSPDNAFMVGDKSKTEF